MLTPTADDKATRARLFQTAAARYYVATEVNDCADGETLGGGTVSKSSFEYVIYIHGEPEDVWRGLTEPEFTRRYWFHDNVSDWTEGAKWESRRSGGGDEAVDIVGVVIEIERPHRLVLSWAPPADADDPDKVSRVSFEMSAQNEWPHGPWTALRLVHSELEPDSDMLMSMTFGWPAVLSGLKSVLESPEIFT